MTEGWLERWQDGRIGWHQHDGNASLRKHWRATGRRVLVPLCGKTPDLLWLVEQGNKVIGVELSQLAVEAFFAEHGIDYVIEKSTPLRYDATDIPLTIYCGDYFELQQVRCDAHYDRAALVAMPADLRPAYAAHTNSLLERGAEQLVITLVYDESIATGPPWSVDSDELLGYWPNLECVEACDDLDDAPPKFVEAGLTEIVEKIWRTG